MVLPKVQVMDKEARSLCKMEGIPLQGRPVERVGNPSKEAVLDGPGAPSHEGRRAYLVLKVWEIHRKSLEGVESLVHREADKSYQAEEVATGQAPH